MSHKEIYIIDDDIAVRDSLSFLLETHGFRVTAFENGDLFLETDLSHYHAPILLDVRMPGRDGLEVLKIALEKNPKRRHLNSNLPETRLKNSQSERQKFPRSW